MDREVAPREQNKADKLACQGSNLAFARSLKNPRPVKYVETISASDVFIAFISSSDIVSYNYLF